MNNIIQGSRFGRLVLIEILPGRGAGLHRLGRWQCDCGVIKEVSVSRVKNGYAGSCGCLSVEARRTNGTTHGMRYSPEYRSWVAMIGRCHNHNHKDYPRWGARGITVCPEWRNSFEAFFAHIGPRPAGTSVDRKDGTRGYEPGNVRWATPREQARNRRDFVIIKTPLGTMPLIDYAAHIGISKGAAHLRLKRGKLEGCLHA